MFLRKLLLSCGLFAHRNNVIFKDDKCNLVLFLSWLVKRYMRLQFYKNCANIPIILKDAGSNSMNVGKRFRHQYWTPPLQHWLKYNTNASKNKTNKMTTISYFCKNTNDRIINKYGLIFGDLPILRIETLAIRKVLKHAMQESYSRVIESDLLIVLQAINGILYHRFLFVT